MTSSRLGPFQQQVLEAFFERAAPLPGGVWASELREYLEDLRSRLLRLAHPE